MARTITINIITIWVWSSVIDDVVWFVFVHMCLYLYTVLVVYAHLFNMFMCTCIDAYLVLLTYVHIYVYCINEPLCIDTAHHHTYVYIYSYIVFSYLYPLPCITSTWHNGQEYMEPYYRAHRPQVPGASTARWCFGEWQTSCGSLIARLCVWVEFCKKEPMNLAWHPLLLTPAYHPWTWRRAGSTTKFAPNGFLGFQIWKKCYQTYVKSLQGSIATIWYNYFVLLDWYSGLHNILNNNHHHHKGWFSGWMFPIFAVGVFLVVVDEVFCYCVTLIHVKHVEPMDQSMWAIITDWKITFNILVVWFTPRHAWCHMVFEFDTSDENCRNHKTLAEEDMLGKITKIASAAHGATVAKRFFQRFSLFLGMHWEKLCNLQDMEIQEIWWKVK